MTDTKKDRRPRKRRYNKLLKALKKNLYFEDCNFHVSKKTQVDDFDWQYSYDAGIEGISLFDGLETSCSLMYCGPKPLTEKEALERIEYVKNNTWVEYLFKYVYDINSVAPENREKAREELENHWAEHNFRKADLEFLNQI